MILCQALVTRMVDVLTLTTQSTGMMDALAKGYLKSLMLVVLLDPSRPEE